MPFEGKEKRSINWRNFGICFAISLGMLCMGYPASVISLIIVNEGWLLQMGLVDPQTGKETAEAAGLIGAVNGVFQAGAVINVILTVVVLDRFGRKMSVYYNAVMGLFAGAMATGSMNIATFIAARFFWGASSWGFLVLTPIYCAELSPPDARGFFAGMNGFNISLAYAIAVYFGLGFSYNSNVEATWRGPLGMYLVFPLIIITATIFFAPESPRWLLMKGRVEEARDVVMNIHRVGDNYDFAKEEFYQMQKQVEIDRTLNTSWLNMFTHRPHLHRTALSCLYSFLGQSTAVLVINNYGPTFYASLGYGEKQTLIFQTGWITVAYPFCFLGAYLMDKMGRRPLMMFGIGGCCACVIVLTAASAQLEANPAYTQMGALGVAALYVFIAIYSVGVDVGGNVFYAEVFPNHVRSKGVALANMVLALSDLVYLQVTPTAQKNIGWKWFLLFIVLSGLGTILLYFVLPETKNIPLEELGRLFGDKDIAVYSDNIHIGKDHEVEVGGGDEKGIGLGSSGVTSGHGSDSNGEVDKSEGVFTKENI